MVATCRCNQSFCDLWQKQPELHIEIPMGPQGLTIPIRKVSMGN